MSEGSLSENIGLRVVAEALQTVLWEYLHETGKAAECV